MCLYVARVALGARARVARVACAWGGGGYTYILPLTRIIRILVVNFTRARAVFEVAFGSRRTYLTSSNTTTQLRVCV